MNNFISILLQVSVSIALLFIIYYAFLRKDTFFRTNRFYLIISLLASLSVPFIDIGFLLGSGQQAVFVLLDPIVIRDKLNKF